MIDNIELIIHSCIKFSGDKIIYFDPFKIKEEKHDADIIFITHSHYDHYSIDDINKVKNNNTILVVPLSMKDDIKSNNYSNVIYVEPNKSYNIEDINFDTIPSYNTNKQYHKKENNWVGYIITINNIKYYIAGDTDETDENMKVNCDVAFLPIGGVFTMDYKEAAHLCNTIKPSIVVPIHYGSIVGDIELGEKFCKLIDNNIKCVLMIK